jgi:hypothetical protein
MQRAPGGDVRLAVRHKVEAIYSCSGGISMMEKAFGILAIPSCVYIYIAGMTGLGGGWDEVPPARQLMNHRTIYEVHTRPNSHLPTRSGGL